MGFGKAVRNAFIGLVLFIVIATAPGRVNAFRDWIMGSANRLGNAATTNMPKPPGQRGSASIQGRLGAGSTSHKKAVKKKPAHRKHRGRSHSHAVVSPLRKP